jgi:hypothetical protein
MAVRGQEFRQRLPDFEERVACCSMSWSVFIWRQHAYRLRPLPHYS